MKLRWRCRARLLTGTTTGAHFHAGAVGMNGPVVIDHGITAGVTRWRGSNMPLSTADETALLGGMWYTNVHTTTLPSGEIRGQVDGFVCT